mgnify:CR=1 FL=1
MRKYKLKELRELVRLRITPINRANIFTRSAGSKKWAILRAFMVSMADWSKIPKPGSYTQLLGVALICLFCFKGVILWLSMIIARIA